MDIARKDARPCISMSCTAMQLNENTAVQLNENAAVHLIEKVEGNLYKVTKQAQHNN